MHLLWSLGRKRRKFSTSTPALLPVANALQPSAPASPPPLPASHSEELPGPREEEPTAVTSAPATPAFYLAHLKRSSCIVTSSPSLQDDAEESGSSSSTTTTTTTTMTSTRNVLEEAWPQDDDEDTDQSETISKGKDANVAEDEEDAEAAVRRGEERRERKKQLKRERREKRERKREEKMEKTNNRGREAEKRALREAEEEEEDMRVLLAACQLQGETRNQTAFACSGRTKDHKKKAESDKKKKKEKGGKEKSPEVKKSRRERKLEKRENKKDKKQRKIDKELQKQREKEEKRRSRNRGHARSSSDGAALASSNINSSAAGLSSSASMSSITKPRKSWRPSTWRMSSIACLGRSPSMDGEDSPLQTSSDSHSLDGPRGDKGSTSRRRRSSIEKGKDKQRDHGEDDDPDKKSGPGKVLEEGTMEPCGEDGEDEGWSEESVEWCGVKYAKNDLPPFDTSGLRGKTAYNPNHCLWLATAAALAYRSPAQIRHVVTRIWEWEDMEFFHNAETDTQGFGAYGKDCIVICFRGTESSRDWSTNIKISETEPFPDMPAVKVHNGFNRALTSVLEQVVDFIAKGLEFNPSLPLYITGHSLGGALANMCLAYFTFPSSPFLLKTLACPDTSTSTSTSTSSSSSSSCSSSSDEAQVAASRREPLIKGVYTFGQPKVGNEQFAYELRVHSAGTVFFRLTNNNDLVPFVPRRLYVHCGTRLFLSEAGHIVQGDEAARPAREFWRENNHGRMFKRKRQGFRDHLVKSYVAFVREHYRINEAILMSPLRKDMPLLRFHDMERAKLSCEEMRQLVSFDSVIEGLKHMTVSDLMDTRSLAMTAKQRKKEAQTLGRKWLREQLWEKLKDNEDQQIKKCYKALKCEVEKKKAKYRGDSAKLDKQQPNNDNDNNNSSSSSSDAPPPAVAKEGGGKSNGPIGAIFASFASLKDALRADS